MAGGRGHRHVPRLPRRKGGWGQFSHRRKGGDYKTYTTMIVQFFVQTFFELESYILGKMFSHLNHPPTPGPPPPGGGGSRRKAANLFMPDQPWEVFSPQGQVESFILYSPRSDSPPGGSTSSRCRTSCGTRRSMCSTLWSGSPPRRSGSRRRPGPIRRPDTTRLMSISFTRLHEFS